MVSLDHDVFIILSASCVLFFLLISLRHFARNSVLPPESWLLLAGVGYGVLQHLYIPELPALKLTPELVLWLLLPVLIFASARHISPRALTKEALPIFFFAVIGVILTLFLIGVPVAFIMGIPLLHGLFFAAAVAATDPSAVAAIFQRFPIPERLSTLLEGESMFNDGTAIVLFTLMASLVLADQQLDLTQALTRFGWSIIAAIPIGFAAGWLAGKLVSFWQEQNTFIGLSITLLLAYGSYLLAEGVLHVSGVITVLCAALAFIYVSRKNKPSEQSQLFNSFWEYLENMSGSVLFFFLGVAAGTHEFPLSWAIPGVILILLVARAVVVYGGSLLINPIHNPLPMSWQHVMMLGGLRGAVSAALLLMIPEDYPYLIQMLCLVFTLCVYTLVVHPFLLRLYLQKGTVKE